MENIFNNDYMNYNIIFEFGKVFPEVLEVLECLKNLDAKV